MTGRAESRETLKPSMELCTKAGIGGSSMRTP